MSTPKIADWLERISKVTEYRSKGLQRTFQRKCSQCGKILNGKDPTRMMIIIGVDSSNIEDQKAFFDICDKCYSSLKTRIHQKMQ